MEHMESIVNNGNSSGLAERVSSDDSMFEDEVCGLCRLIIIDRGVLDCCQHWFCFQCIDEWSTITNLCPLCHNEFQLITCVPVIDTIGGNTTDEDSFSRNNDWSVEGKSSTLSFPSYYIDENSVTCLDGDGCKLRSDSVTIDENLELDTSIACDSCDTWYHAFCVGFDTESTTVESWLCPRCLVNEAQQDQYNSVVAGNQCSGDTFSGKVSISVADDGETAMVVSLVDQKHLIEETNDKPLTTDCLEFDLVNQSSQNITNDLSSPNEGDVQLPISTDMTLESAHNNHNSNSNLEECCTSKQYNVSTIDANQIPDEETVSATRADEWQDCSLSRDSSHTLGEVTNAEADVPMLAGEKRRRSVQSSTHGKRAKLATQGLSREFKFKHEKNGEGTSEISLSESAEEIPLDIMSIVQGTESKLKRRDASKPRVKKIVRRPVGDKESSSIVQNLRKEIREAIKNKSSKDVGKNIVDHKLLAAFRAAVAVPGPEPIKKVSSSASVVKPNRLMLQKGKTRENLTKKIYATASGKRRHDWYRDCQVEFWKPRGPKTTENEKIETLKSVLNLLKYDPEANKAEKNSKEEGSDSILSRLYLADASVFPRTDNVKPLITLSSNTENKTADKIEINSASCSAILDTKKSKSNVSVKGKIDKVEDIKTDKRKWALQILARKTASNSTNPGQQKQEDSVLKGKYPLLAQLPVDMRPEMEPCRHNKIAKSVRQAQLYHLAENLLKLTNISPIRKTAATELAIADAVNIEREIAARSTSKAVYINLCSQELRHHKNTHSQSAVENPNPSTVLPVSTETEPSLDPEVEEALKNAGLLPDSPQSDTYHRTENFNDDDDDEVQAKGGPENVLVIDSHPDLDIYGEFEYDIEDEDYIGASSFKDTKLETEEGESKMKLVFSTLITDNKQEEASLMKLDNSESFSLPPVSTNEGENVEDDHTLTECEELYGPEKEPTFESFTGIKSSEVESRKVYPTISDADVVRSAENENKAVVKVEKKQHEIDDSVTKKVEAYIKEHIRPLCKSGVITVEQYRWAVGKTTDKVMKYHSKAKNANFLIKEGEKVKKLAEQYVEGAQLKDKHK